MQLVPKKIFLTKGVGFHKHKLASFEEALRDAGIAQFNLVYVSSIFPPYCQVVTKESGLKELNAGQIVFTVLSKNQSNENRRLLASSVGLAIPKLKSCYGYLSEHHSFGETDKQAGQYAEGLAAEMLATCLGIEFDSKESWDKKRELWKMSERIVKTRNITQTAVGKKNDEWVTTVAVAVLIT